MSPRMDSSVEPDSRMVSASSRCVGRRAGGRERPGRDSRHDYIEELGEGDVGTAQRCTEVEVLAPCVCAGWGCELWFQAWL